MNSSLSQAKFLEDQTVWNTPISHNIKTTHGWNEHSLITSPVGPAHEQEEEEHDKEPPGLAVSL